MRDTNRFLLLLLLVSTIPLAAQQTPYAGNIAIPGTLQVENYDNGGEGVAWHDTTPGNAFGVYRFTDMDVGAIPTGGYHIGALDPGEWAEYTVNVATSGSYTVTLRWASAYPYSTTFRLLLNGVDVSGTQSVTSTGDWQTYTTKTFTANLTAGNNQVLRINFETGAFNPDYLQFTAPSCTAPTIVTNPVSQEADEPYGNVTFSVSETGSTPMSCQWYKNGVAIPGATGDYLTLTSVEDGKDAGTYTAVVSNACGSRTSAPATFRVKCGNPAKPGLIAENIGRAFRNQSDLCDWGRYVSMSFPNTLNGGSNNIPVAAAAVAYIKQPVKNTAPTWNMYTFWDTYLRGELGERVPSWYYGGTEVGSYDYHHYNVMSVLAVHYRAHTTSDANVEGLARRWLRATFLMHALAAMPEQPLTLRAKGQFITPSTNLVAPYVAMAGERSAWGFWMYRDRNIMFAKAVGLYTNGLQESNEQSSIRSYVEQWSGVYALSDPEKTYLRNIVNNRTLVPYADGGSVPYLRRDFLSSLVNGVRYDVKIRTHYQFVGWPRAKAVIMSDSTNTNTVPTFGTAYFLDQSDPNVPTSGREAHFLYPWSGLFGGGDEFKNGVCTGTAFIDLTNRFMQAYHPTCPNGAKPIKHPEETQTIYNLPPQSSMTYSVALDPNGAVVCTPACP